jgi:hypothetical protein
LCPLLNAEADIRNTFWYPNIKRGDVVVNVGAAYSSYGFTPSVLGAFTHMLEIHPVLWEELRESIKLIYLKRHCKLNEFVYQMKM